MSQTFARSSKSVTRMRTLAALALGALMVPAAVAHAAERPGITFSKAAESTRAKSSKDITFDAPAPGVVTVSDRDFNRFVFPAPVRKLVMPAGTPILGEPIYMAGNTVVLVQFQRGADKSVEFIAETDQGTVHSVRVLPRPVDGVVHRVDGAREPRTTQPGRASRASAEPASPRGEAVELLKQVVMGEVPDGFEPIALPGTTRFDKFSVVPLSGWSDGMSVRIMAFSLVAAEGQTAVVAPPQFYRPGIAAVLVDGDVVDAHASPTLYVVEDLGDE